MEWEIIGKEKLMVDEAAVLVLNHQAGASTLVRTSLNCGVADPGNRIVFILTGSRITDPGFQPESRIQKRNQRGGGRDLLSYPFFGSH